MDYGRNDVSYLDDVYIGGNRLSGYLDGRNNFVEYTGRWDNSRQMESTGKWKENDDYTKDDK